MRTDSRLCAVVTLLAASSIVGCANGADGAAASEREVVWQHGDDSGHTVVSAAAQWAVDTALRCVSDSLLEAFAVDATAGALLLTPSVLAIPNPGTSQVVFLDLDRGEAMAHGREGAGPGEFRRIWSVVRLGGDTVLAFDRLLRRVVALTPQDGPVWTKSIPAPPQTDSAVIVEVAGMLEPRTAVVLAWSARGVQMGRTRSDLLVYAWDVDTNSLTRLARGFGQEVQVEFIDAGPDPAFLPPMFPRESVVAVSGARVVVAHDEAFELWSMGSGGGDTLLVRLTVEPEKMSRARIAAERSDLMARYPSLPAKIVDKLEAQIPDRVPTVRGVLGARDGEVWFSPEWEPARWLVFMQSGQLIAAVDHPDRIDRLVDVTDEFVLGINENESGVAVPCRARLVK